VILLLQKPGLELKPGRARPKPVPRAWLMILESQGRLRPGQSWGFQAKPEPANH